MASVNKVILIGNLRRDPETRMTADGRPICSLALATTRRYKDSQGALQEETEWHRVTLFGRQAEVAQQYLKKGNPVYIEGRIRTNRYTDKDGIERWSTGIIAESMQLLGSRNTAAGGQSQQGAYGAPAGDDGFESPRRAPAARPAAPARSADEIAEDDVPF